MSNRYTLRLPRDLHDAMIAHAQAELPNECCGLLAGHLADGIGTVTLRLPLVNDHDNPSRRFSSEPKSMLDASRAIDAAETDWLAIYHSHPTSEAIPSATDLAENLYGDSIVHLIISLMSGRAEVRCWWLGELAYTTANWELIENSEG